MVFLSLLPGRQLAEHTQPTKRRRSNESLTSELAAAVTPTPTSPVAAVEAASVVAGSGRVATTRDVNLVVSAGIDPHCKIRSKLEKAPPGDDQAAKMGQKVSGGIKTIGREPTLKTFNRESVMYNPDYQKPSRLDMLLDMPPAPKEVQIAHSWNTEDRSLNIFVKEDDAMTFHRHPVAQSTD